jgi:hypothetical protein
VAHTMDRPRLIPGLRIAVTAMFGILCLLLIILWVRSFWRINSLNSFGNELRIDSNRGELIVTGDTSSLSTVWKRDWEWEWGWEERRVNELDQSYRMTRLGFFYQRRPHRFWLVIPYWFPVVISVALATVPWIHWSKRFSLRTLLVAITLVAIALAIAASMRSS